MRLPRRAFGWAGFTASFFVLHGLRPESTLLHAQKPTRLTGVWQATVGVDYAPWTIVLEQRGDSLFGNIQQNGGLRGPSDIREGHIDRGRITFSAPAPTGGRTIKFVGILQGDSITFERTVIVAAEGARIGTGLFGAGGAERFVVHRADVSTGAASASPGVTPPAATTPPAVATKPLAVATPPATRAASTPVRQRGTASVPPKARQAKVLVLYGFRPGSITHIVASATLHERLAEVLGDSVSIVEEFPEFASTPISALYQRDALAATESFRRYLSLRYSSTPFDLVLTVGQGGLGFYKVSKPPLFPGVPVIASLVSADRIPPEWMDSTVSVVSNSIGLKGTLSLALAMQPETKRVVVVGGGSNTDLGYVLRTQLVQQSFPNLRFDYVVGRSLAETERTVSQLDGHSIVLLLSFAADSAGNQYDRFEVAQRLASVAEAPIYSSFGPWLGSGVVGGEMNMADSNVARASALALRALRGERFANLPRLVIDPTVRVLDDRALRRWRLDETRAPSGTSVLYREPSLWSRYRGVISLTLALLLAQTAVIAALVVQRARRRRAELRADALMSELRVSHDRIHQLAGHLITAQEAERTRIARELHDDVNQKIASLAIGLSRVRRHVGDGGEAANDLSGLQARTATLAEDVRHISHRLHSSVLQHAGLVAALETVCREFSIDHGVEVDFETEGDVDGVDYEIALCLYRVVQEALRNAARHAQAGTVRVLVARDAHAIRLEVVDDGRGFDPRAARMAPGLGLVSLEERARLVQGTVAVESKPGHGTVVRLTVPLTSGLQPASPPEDHAARQGIAG